MRRVRGREGGKVGLLAEAQSSITARQYKIIRESP